MQFNRREYLKGNFDTNSPEERKNAYYATKLIGLDWNNYIKEYFKDCMGDAIGTFEYSYQLVMPFATVGVLVDFGLFKQAAEYLNTLVTDNEEFEVNSSTLKKAGLKKLTTIHLDDSFDLIIKENRALEKGYDKKRQKHFYKLYFDKEK